MTLVDKYLISCEQAHEAIDMFKPTKHSMNGFTLYVFSWVDNGIHMHTQMRYIPAKHEWLVADWCRG